MSLRTGLEWQMCNALNTLIRIHMLAVALYLWFDAFNIGQKCFCCFF